VPHAGAPDLRAEDSSKRARARAPYDEEVWFTDAQIGRLLTFVAAQPWAVQTAIVVTADHGEAFGEHDHWAHGRELWEPLVRVPLLVYVPGATGRRVAVKRSHIDLAPTILELAGVPVPNDGSLRGTSLVSDVLAPQARPPAERDVFVDMPVGPFNEMRRALIRGNSPGEKLIDFGRRYELYDLGEDPEELHDLAGDAPRLARAKEALAKYRENLDEQPAR
jgi:arylsulfatase A-like enzyme